MAVLKKELQLGDILVTRIDQFNRYVEVIKLDIIIPPNSENVVESQFVGIKVLENGELKSVEEGDLNPIVVNQTYLEKLGFKTHTKDGITLFYLGRIVLSKVALAGKGWTYQSSLSLIEDWAAFVNCRILFNDGFDEGNKRFIATFKPMYELHTLMNYLKEQGYNYDIEDILIPVKLP